MKLLKTLLGIILIALVANVVTAQSFEGQMKLKRATKFDTTYYSYYVKGFQVRIDELNDKGEVEGTMILNVKDRKIFALSPGRKLYYEIPFSGTTQQPVNNNLEIVKGKNKKTIAGFICEQWIVKNKVENTSITYWIVPTGFDFYKDFLITLNRKDKLPSYFLQIDGIAGVIPFLSIERTLLRDEISSLEVTEAIKKKIDDKTFQIPLDYREYKK